MSRFLVAIGSLAILALACSLGGSDTSEQTSPEDSPSSGGVPISKSTSVPVKETARVTEQSPVQESEPTSLPQTTPAPVPATSSPGATVPVSDGGPVQVIDLFVIQPGENPRLLGVVQNVSNTDLFGVELTVTFFDADGNVADTRFTGTDMSTLPSGEISPFQFFFPSGVPASVDAVGVRIEWQEVYEGYNWTRQGIELSSVEGAMGPFNLEISGVVTNNTGRDAASIWFTAIAYNASGQMIGYGGGGGDPLAAGASAPFEALIAGGDSLAEPVVDRFVVLAEALLEN